MYELCKDIAHDVSTGSMWGAEGTCGGGAGQHGDGAGRGMCGECEWGLTFFLHIVCDAWVHHCATRQHVFLVQVTPDVEVTLEDRVVFVRSQQGRAGTCYAHCLVDAEALRPRKDRWKSAVGT